MLAARHGLLTLTEALDLRRRPGAAGGGQREPENEPCEHEPDRRAERLPSPTHGATLPQRTASVRRSTLCDSAQLRLSCALRTSSEVGRVPTL